MKKFLLIFLAVVLLAFVAGAGGLYWMFHDPANREAFTASFVEGARPAFLENCIKGAHRTSASTGPEVDKGIEIVCTCAANKMIGPISSQKSSLSGLGAAIYQMVFDSKFRDEVVNQCLQERSFEVSK